MSIRHDYMSIRHDFYIVIRNCLNKLLLHLCLKNELSYELHYSSCMQGTCTLCSKIEVDIANDNSHSSDSELEAASQDDTSSDTDSTPTLKYYKWATIDSKV